MKVCSKFMLTEVAGEGGPDLPPQKFLLSQKFRHLMRCKNILKRAAERLLWQKFAIFSGVRLVRSMSSLHDMRTNPGEANGFFKIQPTYFL